MNKLPNVRYGRKDNTPATPPNTNTPATPPPSAPDTKGADSSDVTLAEVGKIVGEQLVTALKAQLPEHLKGFATAEAVTAAVRAELAKHGKETDDVKAVDLQKVATSVADGAAKTFGEDMRRHPKFKADAQDADNGGKSGGTVEIPTAWVSGNLPLHGKQLLNVMLGLPMNHGVSEKQLADGMRRGTADLNSLQQKAMAGERAGWKALTSTGSGSGDELVPSDLSAMLQRRFYLASPLAAAMAAREFEMPTNPYTWPLSTTRPTFFLESTENTTTTESSPGTGSLTITAKTFRAKTQASYELEEDSIIPVIPFLQQQLAEAGAAAWEDSLINGDDTGTHQDTDVQAVAKHVARAFKGFRKLALSVSALKSDLSSGGLNEANLRALRRLLKKYGTDPRSLVWLASPTSSLAMQDIANVSTMEKYGARATIISGELAALFGIPIIASESVREDVDATGVNGASGNTKAFIVLARLDRFATGRKRDVTVEVDRNIESGTHTIVASFRRGFAPFETPSASVPSVAIGYNFAP